MKVSEEGIRRRLAWQANDEKDIEKARDYFMKLTRQGWLAARHNGEYKRILTFVPEYGEIWFIPLAEGG